MKQIIAILSIILYLSAQAQQYGINTIAGNGTVGYSGDGGQATAASFQYPKGTALSAQGNLYIADLNDCRIRKVNTNTGIITTVAGNGTWGFSGDNGQAIAAQILYPADVILDAQENLYIADRNNGRIRKVNTSTGIITTIAGGGNPTPPSVGDGGLATAALVNMPVSVAIDANGNIYIAGLNTNRIRKVDVSTGIITTVVGTGTAGFSGDGGLATAAQLNNPQDVTIDAQGNIYVADAGNNRIRKVNANTGIITTVAGGGTSFPYPLTGDGGQATAAIVSGPISIAVDASGNIYIAEPTHRIRKVNANTGIITTIAGNSLGGFSGDGGLATAAQLDNPQGLTADPQGNLYIADFSSSRIRKLRPCHFTTATASQYTVCSGISTILSVSGMTSHVWSNGAATASTSVTPVINTTYSVTGVDSIGCPSIAIVNIQVSALPTISINSATICPAVAGSTIVLMPNGANTYSITGGSFTVNPNLTTSYSVTGTDGNGCVSSNTAVANVLVVTNLPNINITGNTSICANETTILGANGANTYTWTYIADNGLTWTNATTLSINPSVSTTYSLQATDSNGCIGNRNSVTVYVDLCTGIKELKDKSLVLSVYPNPNKGEFTIELNNNANTIIEMLDMTGKLILSNSTRDHKISFNISELAKGIYFLKIISNNAVEIMKVAKE